jgi:hypothetical protein
MVRRVPDNPAKTARRGGPIIRRVAEPLAHEVPALETLCRRKSVTALLLHRQGRGERARFAGDPDGRNSDVADQVSCNGGQDPESASARGLEGHLGAVTVHPLRGNTSGRTNSTTTASTSAIGRPTRR